MVAISGSGSRCASLAGAMSSCVVLRVEVRAAAVQMADAAENWRHAYDDWQRAVKARGVVAERIDRRITKATGGLSVTRFEAVCRRRSFHDVEAAKAKARAIRARPAVAAAIAERDRVLGAEDAKVLAARDTLAEASKTMARYGTVGLDMIGQSARELRRLTRLARQPPTS